MNLGTAQGQRYPPAPPAREARQFGVDELALHQRVAMAAGLAARLRFVDLNNHESGTWAPLFEGDESLLLAGIASFDRRGRQSDFLQIDQWAPLERLAWEVARLARQLDDWYRLLPRPVKRPRAVDPRRPPAEGPESVDEDALTPQDGEAPIAAALRARIEQVVGRELPLQLAWVVLHFGARQWQGRNIAGLVAGLDKDKLWKPAQTARTEVVSDERAALRRHFHALMAAVARVQARALELLPQTLQTQRHEPAAGLLLAFLRLYDSVQGRMNAFTDRHIDFYYRQCLGLKPRPAQADQAHVVCSADPRAPKPVLVPAGALFGAGKDAEGRAIEFRSEEELLLGDACVAQLSTLRLERDPQISPEGDLGYVTRAKATRIPSQAPAGCHWPLFGGNVSPELGGSDAQLGLALATPLLRLEEGQRLVLATLPLRWPNGGWAALLEKTLNAQDAAQFRIAFGRLFSCWLLSERDHLISIPMQPADADLQRLRERAVALGMPRPQADNDPAKWDVGEPLYLLWAEGWGQDEPAYPQRDLMLDRLLRNAFDVDFTAADGWKRAAHVQIRRAASSDSGGGGLQLMVHLHPSDEAVVGCDPAVHGAHWPTRLPVMRLQATTRARMFPYSLFDGAELIEARLKVSVAGVRNLALHNNLGRLDPSKAFNPFGPLPTLSSYLVFGAPEAGRKNLDALALNIRWGGLPRDVGGFDSYYEGYGPDQCNGAYKVALSILSDGQWQPCTGISAQQPLFEGLDAGGRLFEDCRIEVDGSSVRTHTRASNQALDYGVGSRNGFFRMQLSAPLGAFGHQAYPQMLAAAVTPRRWGGRPGGALPNLPYTPLIESLTLDYEAHTTIRVRREDDGDSERMLHVHPFGVTELSNTGSPPGVLLRIEHDGNLYIGLAATELEGPLTLLFHLHEEGANDAPIDPRDEGGGRSASWACMDGDRWQALPASRVLSDTTGGFLTSGIVTLDLPPKLARNTTVIDAGLVWLRASADRGFEAKAPLYGVHAQALALTRVLDPERKAALVPLDEGRVAEVRSAVVGLAAVTQVGASFGLRAAEDQRQMRVRAGERLRHKNRASLVWDTERLVLEHFPEVFKVKCFTPQESGLEAGQVRVVVIPALRRGEAADNARAPRLSAIVLRRIRDFLAERASAFATISVRNVAYERIQVRCTVQIQRGAQGGRVLQRVNDAIVEHLSPWNDPDYGPRLDWVLRCDDVEARIRQVPGVQAVGKLSLLGVARADASSRYTLHDTARPGPGQVGGELRANSRWSIALPMREHLLSNDELRDPAPEETGVKYLKVGATFVIQRSAAA